MAGDMAIPVGTMTPDGTHRWNGAVWELVRLSPDGTLAWTGSAWEPILHAPVRQPHEHPPGLAPVPDEAPAPSPAPPSLPEQQANASAADDVVTGELPAPPQLSDDGRWWWTGSKWLPAPPASAPPAAPSPGWPTTVTSSVGLPVASFSASSLRSAWERLDARWRFGAAGLGLLAALLAIASTAGAFGPSVDESSPAYAAGVQAGAEGYGVYYSLHTAESAQSGSEWCEAVRQQNPSSEQEIEAAYAGCVDGAECWVDIEGVTVDEMLDTGAVATFETDCSREGKAKRREQLAEANATARGES